MNARWLAPPLLLAAISCGPGVDGDLPPSYRDLEVPGDRLASNAARARGAVLFQKHCAICHGARGDGHGLRSQALTTRPRDFTSRFWRERTTPRQVYHVIREGARDTPMPSWKSLSEEESWDLVAFVLSLAEGRR